MPVMDGYVASEKILELTAKADQADYCHIVALTSYTSNEVQKKVLDIGFKDIIHKPLHNKDLQKMVYLHFYRKSESQLQEQFPHLF